MAHDVSPQEQGHRTWCIIRLFYLSLVRFREEFDRYDRKVEAHARALGVDRNVLRLGTRDLAELLRFKNLEALRDRSIHELKELCHLVFRTEDETDPLDRYVSDIFHEISILKEEHYTLKTYAPLYERDAAEVELRYIVDDAHTMFPHKLRHIQYLFGKARERMEQYLLRVRFLPIVIRSLYLHREDDFIRKAYPSGIRDFYRLMYPLGSFEGFYHVGQSFYHSAFYPEALEAYAAAEREYRDAVRLHEKLERAVLAGKSTNGPGALLPGAGNAAAADSLRDPRSTVRSMRAKISRIRRKIVGAELPAAADLGTEVPVE